MILERLSMQHYRNATALSLDFHPRLTVLFADNGVGKTNILEAIHLLSLPRSFRGAKDKELLQWEAPYWRVEGEVRLDDGRLERPAIFTQKTKTLLMDAHPLPTTAFIGRFSSVLFAPEEVDLLSSTPARRRAFLDAHLSQLSSSYFTHLLTYNQVLLRRNRLLRTRASRPDELVYWNERQVEHGVALMQAREEAMTTLLFHLPSPLRLRYLPSIHNDGAVLADVFQQKQASLWERESYAGHSLLGPQRDDWALDEGEGGRDLGVYGSRGEQRMAVMSLKQAQIAVVAQARDTAPVLLLDDVLSELDKDNQERLLQSLQGHQTVLTTATLADVPSPLLADALVYRWTDGTWQVYPV